MTVIINRPRAAPMSHRGLELYESPDVANLGLLSAEPDLQRKFLFKPSRGKRPDAKVGEYALPLSGGCLDRQGMRDKANDLVCAP